MNDAFGAAHRAHATTEGVARRLLPAVAGFLLEREVTVLTSLLADPEQPFVVVLGGAKVSDKIGVIERFLEVADAILIGGAMCFSFFRAQGRPTGDSLVEEEGVELARRVLERAERSRCRLELPRDLVLADRFDGGRRAPRDRTGRTCRTAGWASTSARAPRAPTRARSRPPRTVFWNGPMGAFELEPFAAGTRAVAEALARSRRDDGRRRRRLGRGARAVRPGRRASRTSRPAAARRSSCSRASRCPAWRRSMMPS